MKAIFLALPFAVVSVVSAVAEEPSTLGFVETNSSVIEMQAGESGRYTVRTKDGKVLARTVSPSQLQAQFPELHQLVRYGFADASLNLNPSAQCIVQFWKR
jgi:hypothetical protein